MVVSDEAESSEGAVIVEESELKLDAGEGEMLKFADGLSTNYILSGRFQVCRRCGLSL